MVARTGIAGAGFEDPMEVVRWEPPCGTASGRCRLEKRGRVVVGWAEIEVEPAAGGARVVWREAVRIAGLPQLFDAPTRWTARLLFGRVVNALLRDPDGTG
ncbi:conserved protein of unknown function (plasmid) [Streptantibioticus cattleyicolor NRRL 8057 = DSM 46488]|nr:conserved protein of unknown function [Streptantibioticus cattleyicolor NRRL 8057 = DSM 46488]